MRAIDTNILLRLIVGDDPGQEARAHALIRSERVLVPLTVILECEWMLRSYYKLPPTEIARVLDELTGVDGLVFEQVNEVRWALRRLDHRADFADLIHILAAVAGDAQSILTFDGDMWKEAGPDAPIPVQMPA